MADAPLVRYSHTTFVSVMRCPSDAWLNSTALAPERCIQHMYSGMIFRATTSLHIHISPYLFHDVCRRFVVYTAIFRQSPEAPTRLYCRLCPGRLCPAAACLMDRRPAGFPVRRQSDDVPSGAVPLTERPDSERRRPLIVAAAHSAP